MTEARGGETVRTPGGPRSQEELVGYIDERLVGMRTALVRTLWPETDREVRFVLRGTWKPVELVGPDDSQVPHFCMQAVNEYDQPVESPFYRWPIPAQAGLTETVDNTTMSWTESMPGMRIQTGNLPELQMPNIPVSYRLVTFNRAF